MEERGRTEECADHEKNEAEPCRGNGSQVIVRPR